MAIKVGDKAPDFRFKDQYGDEIKLQDLKGKEVLLSRHPLAFTGVCTDQMRALQANYKKIQEKGDIEVIGISIDPYPAKQKWADILILDDIKIVSDFHPYGEVSKAYDVFNEENGASLRANIIIDKEGIVKWVKVYPTAELPDINEVIENL